jgi:hypothetical protein
MSLFLYSHGSGEEIGSGRERKVEHESAYSAETGTDGRVERAKGQI